MFRLCLKFENFTKIFLKTYKRFSKFFKKSKIIKFQNKILQNFLKIDNISKKYQIFFSKSIKLPNLFKKSKFLQKSFKTKNFFQKFL